MNIDSTVTEKILEKCKTRMGITIVPLNNPEDGRWEVVGWCADSSKYGWTDQPAEFNNWEGELWRCKPLHSRCDRDFFKPEDCKIVDAPAGVVVAVLLDQMHEVMDGERMEFEDILDGLASLAAPGPSDFEEDEDEVEPLTWGDPEPELGEQEFEELLREMQEDEEERSTRPQGVPVDPHSEEPKCWRCGAEGVIDSDDAEILRVGRTVLRHLSDNNS